MAGMWKIVGSIISLIVVVGGIALKFPWMFLDILGRVLTMVDSPEAFEKLIDWIASHPKIAVDLGPWILVFAGLVSLIGIHYRFFLRLVRINDIDTGTVNNQKAEKPSDLDELPPPVGTLQYIVAVMTLEFKQSTNQTAGKIQIEIRNPSNRMIQFHAITAGNINGVAFDSSKVEFDGYVNPNQSTYLVSNRIVGVPIVTPTDINEPSIFGIYEYTLMYSYVGQYVHNRKSSRHLKFVHWHQVPHNPPGTMLKIPTIVTTYYENEE